MIETGEIRGVTSTIALMEVLVKPKRDGNERAIDEYKFILQTFPNWKSGGSMLKLLKEQPRSELDMR